MPDAPFSGRPYAVRARVGLLLAAVPFALVAKAPAKAARGPVEPSADQKRQALLAAHPRTDPQAVDPCLRRLDAAWTQAQAKGLLKGAAWQEALSEGRRAILGRAYVDTRPGHSAMTEDQVLKAFLSQGDERRVAHLLCPTEAEAATALKRLQAGEPFDRVAVEVSKDPSTAVNRGELGWVRQAQLVPAFGQPVFAAASGALLGPLKTEFGWHVAKVWEVRSPKPEDFPAVRDALMKQAADAQYQAKRDSLLEGLRRRYPLKPDLTVLGADRSTEALPGDDLRVAGRVAGETLSLKAVKRYMVEVLKTMGQSHSLGAATKARFMEGMADQIRLSAAARAQGLDRRPDLAAALWLDQRERALARFSEACLADMKVPEADLQKHLDAHPDRFRPVGALRLQVLVTDARSRVDEAINAIRIGLGWPEAVAQFGSTEATGNPDLGWVEVASMRKMVDSTILKPLSEGPLSQVVGPALGPDGFMIFRALERRPGPVPPLSECAEAVRADYLKIHGADLVNQSLGD